MLVDATSPDQLHNNFSQAATGAAQEIKNFAQLMEDARSKAAIAKAAESKVKNPEEIKAWMVDEHEDWLEVKRDDVSEDFGRDRDGEQVAETGARVEDMRVVLDQFREAHPSIETSIEEDTKILKVGLIESCFD